MAATPYMYYAARKAQDEVSAQMNELNAHFDSSSQLVRIAGEAMTQLHAQKAIFQEVVDTIYRQKEAEKKQYRDFYEAYRKETNTIIEDLEKDALKNEEELKTFIERDQLTDKIGYGFGALSTLLGLGVGSKFFPFSEALSVAGLYLPYGIGLGQNYAESLEKLYQSISSFSSNCFRNKSKLNSGKEVAPSLPERMSPAAGNPELAITITNGVGSNNGDEPALKANDPTNTVEALNPLTLSLSSGNSVPIVISEVSVKNTNNISTLNPLIHSSSAALKTEVSKIANQLKNTISMTNDFVAKTETLRDAFVEVENSMKAFLSKIELNSNTEKERDEKIFLDYKEKAEQTKVILRERMNLTREKLRSYLEELKLKKSIGIKMGLLVATPVAVVGGALASTGFFGAVLPALSVASFSYSAGNALGRWGYSALNNCWNAITCRKKNKVISLPTATVSTSPKSKSNDNKERQATVSLPCTNVSLQTLASSKLDSSKFDSRKVVADLRIGMHVTTSPTVLFSAVLANGAADQIPGKVVVSSKRGPLEGTSSGMPAIDASSPNSPLNSKPIKQLRTGENGLKPSSSNGSNTKNKTTTPKSKRMTNGSSVKGDVGGTSRPNYVGKTGHL